MTFPRSIAALALIGGAALLAGCVAGPPAYSDNYYYGNYGVPGPAYVPGPSVYIDGGYYDGPYYRDRVHPYRGHGPRPGWGPHDGRPPRVGAAPRPPRAVAVPRIPYAGPPLAGSRMQPPPGGQWADQPALADRP